MTPVFCAAAGNKPTRLIVRVLACCRRPNPQRNLSLLEAVWLPGASPLCKPINDCSPWMPFASNAYGLKSLMLICCRVIDSKSIAYGVLGCLSLACLECAMYKALVPATAACSRLSSFCCWTLLHPFAHVWLCVYLLFLFSSQPTWLVANSICIAICIACPTADLK